MTRAVAFIGSMPACARYGIEYVPLRFTAAALSFERKESEPAFATSPPPRATSAANAWRIESDDSDAFAPSSQVTASACAALRASQVVRATTAMPWPRLITSSTPGSARAAAASKVRTLPPITGQRRTTAMRRPGSVTSMPNTALPSVFAAASRRVECLPSHLYFAGALSAGVSTGNHAAVPASSWYVAVRVLRVCFILPSSAVTSDSGTAHFQAAAWRSFSRVVAPASRSGFA